MPLNSETLHATEARAALLARRGVLARSQRHHEHDGAQLRHDEESRERTSGEEIAEVLTSLSERQRQEVEAIDAALARLDQGTWGLCGTCGKAVGLSRLRALPEARDCLTCASKRG